MTNLPLQDHTVDDRVRRYLALPAASRSEVREVAIQMQRECEHMFPDMPNAPIEYWLCLALRAAAVLR